MTAARDAVIALLPQEIQDDPEIPTTSLGQLITLAGVLHLTGIAEIGKAFQDEDPAPLDPDINADPHGFFKLVQALKTEAEDLNTLLADVKLALQSIDASTATDPPAGSIGDGVLALQDRFATLSSAVGAVATAIDTGSAAIVAELVNLTAATDANT